MDRSDIKTFWIKNNDNSGKQSYRFRGDDFGEWGWHLNHIVNSGEMEYKIKLYPKNKQRITFILEPKKNIQISAPYSRYYIYLKKDEKYVIDINKKNDKKLNNEYVKDNFVAIIKASFIEEQAKRDFIKETNCSHCRFSKEYDKEFNEWAVENVNEYNNFFWKQIN